MGLGVVTRGLSLSQVDRTYLPTHNNNAKRNCLSYILRESRWTDSSRLRVRSDRPQYVVGMGRGRARGNTLASNKATPIQGQHQHFTANNAGLSIVLGRRRYILNGIQILYPVDKED